MELLYYAQFMNFYEMPYLAYIVSVIFLYIKISEMNENQRILKLERIFQKFQVQGSILRQKKETPEVLRARHPENTC